MKKRNLLMLLTLPLMVSLFSCGTTKDPINPEEPDVPGPVDPDKPVEPDLAEATIKIVPDENVLSYTCSLDESKPHKEDDRGSITFKTKENYFIKKVVQNGIVEVHRDVDNKFQFNFSLLEGLNTFEVKTYFQKNEYNDNGLLEGPGNVVDHEGTMSDDVDDIPKPGGIPSKPLPHYENEGTVYFIDSEWWNNGQASTNIICYNYRKKPVHTKNVEIGDMASHVRYDAGAKENVWKWNIDLDQTAYVQFVRTGGNGEMDWNARTSLLSVADYPTIDCFKLTKDEKYYRDDFTGEFKAYADVTTYKFSEYKPPKPEDFGTYTVYCKLSTKWAEDVAANGLDVNIHVWGLAGDLRGWPGSKMEKEGELYKFSIDTMKYQNIIFLLAKDGAQHSGVQTQDLKLPFKEFGKDATILATVKEGGGKVGVDWSAYAN